MPSLPTLTSEQWTELNAEFSAFVYELRQKKAFFTLIHAINEFKEAMAAYSLDLSEYDYFFEKYRVSIKESQDLSDNEMVSRIQLMLGKFSIPYDKSHLESPSIAIKRLSSQKDEQWTLDGEVAVKRPKSKKGDVSRKIKKEEVPKSPSSIIQQEIQLKESTDNKKKASSTKSSLTTEMKRSTATLSLIKTNPIAKSVDVIKTSEKITPIEPEMVLKSISPTPIPPRPNEVDTENLTQPLAPKVPVMEKKTSTLTELPKKPILPPSPPPEIDDAKKVSFRSEKKTSKPDKRALFTPVPIQLSELSPEAPEEIVLNTPQVPKKSSKVSPKLDEIELGSSPSDILRKPTLPPKLDIPKKSKPYSLDELPQENKSSFEKKSDQFQLATLLGSPKASNHEVSSTIPSKSQTSPFPDEKTAPIPEKELYPSVGDADLLGVLKDFDQRKEKTSSDSKISKKSKKLKDFELESEKK